MAASASPPWGFELHHIFPLKSFSEYVKFVLKQCRGKVTLSHFISVFPNMRLQTSKGQKIGVRRWLLWQFGDCVNVSLIWASLSLSWFLLDIRFCARGRGTLYSQWESGQETLHCNEREIGHFVGTQNERIKFVSQSDADSSKHKTLSVADGDGWPSC